MKDCAKQTKDACQQGSMQYFSLSFTNTKTAMPSATSTTEQSPSINLLKDLVLRGVGEGRGGEEA